MTTKTAWREAKIKVRTEGFKSLLDALSANDPDLAAQIFHEEILSDQDVLNHHCAACGLAVSGATSFKNENNKSACQSCRVEFVFGPVFYSDEQQE